MKYKDWYPTTNVPKRTEVKNFLKQHNLHLSFLPNSSSKCTILFDFSEWQHLYKNGTEKEMDKLKKIITKQKKYKLVKIPSWGYQLQFNKKTI